ncbi:RloB family protein [Nonomuraea gerenzanensis]|uniref:RloB family protein n=1 Tax=Nonomuraea gerenzanensis TaxID=93944 RepID=UPI001CD9D86C|nr:RloB family protein [Nonomuraea gerenzanensis]UBU11992.1 RloB family protein [Nonomuraea gerenzanensis]
MTRKPRGRAQKSSAQISERRTLHVYTEGTKTEVIYLQHWHRLYRDRAIVTIDGFHGPPSRLVRAAVDRKRDDQREEKRGRGQAFSEYWCMFDVDEFPNLPETYQLAAQHDIKIAVSNPCVELWFLLHFQDQTASLEGTAAQGLATRHLSCGKSLTPRALEQLVEHYGVAMERAEKLDSKHEGDGSPARSNPSSSVWRLIERIRSQ